MQSVLNPWCPTFRTQHMVPDFVKEPLVLNVAAVCATSVGQAASACCETCKWSANRECRLGRPHDGVMHVASSETNVL